MNMGKFRKAIASLAMVAVLSTLVVSVGAFAVHYEDVSVSDWSYPYIEQLLEEGVLDETKETFSPEEDINRAEFGKMVVEKFGHEGEGLCSETFEDCTEGAWYDEVLGIAIAHNLLRGDEDGNMRPGDSINRAEAMTVLHRAAGEPATEKAGAAVFSDVSSESWYDQATGWGYCYADVDGYDDGTFGSSRNLTRQEAAKLIVTVSEPSATPRAACLTVDPPVATGDLTVSFASNNPATGGSILVDNTNSEAEHLTLMGAYNFKATGGDVNVTSLTFERQGYATDAEIEELYLYVDGDLVLKTPSNVTTRQFVFTDNSGLFEVSSGATANVELRMDILDSINSGVAISFDLTGANVEGGTVGGLPRVGSQLATVHVSDMATLAIDLDDTVNYPVDRKIGAKKENLAEFNLDVGQEVIVQELAFELVGTLSTSDLANFELVNINNDEEVLGSVASMTEGKMVKFTGLNLELDSSEDYYIRGDIMGGASRTFTFTRNLETDFNIVDAEFGVRIKPDITTSGSKTDGGQVTIQEGDFEAELASSSPIGGIVPNATTEQLLGEYEFTAKGERVKINSITFQVEDVDTQGSIGSFTDLRVLIDGSQVGSKVSTLAVDTGTTVTTNRNIALGETVNVQVWGKTPAVASFAAGKTVRIANSGSGINYDLLDSNTKDQDLNLPTGNTLISAASSLDVKISSSPQASLLAMGETYEVGRWTVKPENEDTRIRELNFTGTSSLITNVESATVKLYQGSELLASRTRTTQNNNHATSLWFGNIAAKNTSATPAQSSRLNWDLEKDTTYTIIVELTFKPYADGQGAVTNYQAQMSLAANGIVHYPAISKSEDNTYPASALAGPTHELRRGLLSVSGTNTTKTAILDSDQEVLGFSLSETSNNSDVEVTAFEIKTGGNLTVTGTEDVVVYEGNSSGPVVARLRNDTATNSAAYQGATASDVVFDGVHGLEVGDVVRIGGTNLVVHEVTSTTEAVMKTLAGLAPSIGYDAATATVVADGGTLVLASEKSFEEEVTVVIEQAAGDALAVDFTAGVLTISLANTTAANNNVAAIQAAVRAENALLDAVVATDGGSWDGNVTGATLTTATDNFVVATLVGNAAFLDTATLKIPVESATAARFVLKGETNVYVVEGDLTAGASANTRSRSVRLSDVTWKDGAATTGFTSTLLKTLPVIWTHSE
jgi:hypothetical protein